MNQPRSDTAWIIDPGWLVFLGGYRVHNSISTSWHYLAAGVAVEAIGAVFKEMSRRRRERRADWFFDEARRLFELRGDQLWLRDEHYRRPTTSLFGEGDVALVFASRSGTEKRGFPLDLARLRGFGELLPRLRPTRSAVELASFPDLWDAAQLLRDRGLVAEVPVQPRRPAATDCGVRVTGHAGALVETPATRVLIDPLLTVRYRPEIDRLHELDAPLDAVVITQARWSHFALDTLIHLERSVPIYLPRPSCPSSLDNIDMYALLRELGFETLRPLTNWQPEAIGDVVVTALPFRGAGLGPDSPADWMTVHVAVGGRRALLATNACADQRGSMDDVIRDMVRRLGPVDLVFASYEDYHYPVSWFTRRPFYLGPGREQSSTSPDDAVRWMVLAGARHLVPYASFAWSDDDLRRGPPDRVLYGGVVQRGSFARLDEQLADWPGALIALLPGDELRWRGASDPTVDVARVANRRGHA